MQTRVVAKTIVVDSDSKILLIRRSASDDRRPLQWDVPGGHTDGQEYAEEAAVREAREEAGLEIQPRDLRLVYTTCDMVEDDLNVVWLFFVCPLAAETPVTLSSEHDEYQWLALDEAISALAYERQKRALEYIRRHSLLHE